MKIVIKADGVRLRLHVPLSFVKSRIGYNAMKNALEGRYRKDEQLEQIKQELDNERQLNREQMIEVYNILKRYVKANGHFNLIEVISHDGDKVLIRV